MDIYSHVTGRNVSIVLLLAVHSVQINDKTFVFRVHYQLSHV